MAQQSSVRSPKNVTNVGVTHLKESNLRQEEKVVPGKHQVPPKPEPEEDDWGTFDEKSEEPEDENDEETEEEVEEVPVAAEEKPQEETVSNEETKAFMEMWAELRAKKDVGLAAFDVQIKEHGAKLEEMRRHHENLIEQRNEFARSVGAPLLEMEEGTRRRRRRTEVETNTTNPDGSTRQRRGPRQKNDKTLKEAILDVIQKRGKPDLKTISNDITSSGFKTNSKNFPNTVRVQLYRLDDDGEIRINNDGTFELREKNLKTTAK